LEIGKRTKTEWTKAREGYEKTELGQDAAISVEEEAIFVQSYKSRARDLDLEHTLDARSPGDYRVQVWSQSSHLPARKSEFRASTKVPYHVTFVLDLALEHTLDVELPGDQLVQVWSQSSHLSRRRSDLRKKFTDGRTDGQTDDGRCAIVLAHGMTGLPRLTRFYKHAGSSTNRCGLPMST